MEENPWADESMDLRMSFHIKALQMSECQPVCDPRIDFLVPLKVL